MKLINLTTLLFGLLLFGCNQPDNKNNSSVEGKAITSLVDLDQIQNLIRHVLTWADSKNSLELLPLITDSNDSIYIGFDLDKHKQNLDQLRQTDFFAPEFIENYNQIILELDKGIRNGNYDLWFVGELPTFTFSNNQNPWCNCQDNSDWNEVVVKGIKLTDNEGELEWTWGIHHGEAHSRETDFAYKFRVVKDNDKWRVSYMTGFDFKLVTRKV